MPRDKLDPARAISCVPGLFVTWLGERTEGRLPHPSRAYLDGAAQRVWSSPKLRASLDLADPQVRAGIGSLLLWSMLVDDTFAAPTWLGRMVPSLDDLLVANETVLDMQERLAARRAYAKVIMLDAAKSRLATAIVKRVTVDRERHLAAVFDVLEGPGKLDATAEDAVLGFLCKGAGSRRGRDLWRGQLERRLLFTALARSWSARNANTGRAAQKVSFILDRLVDRLEWLAPEACATLETGHAILAIDAFERDLVEGRGPDSNWRPSLCLEGLKASLIAAVMGYPFEPGSDASRRLVSTLASQQSWLSPLAARASLEVSACVLAAVPPAAAGSNVSNGQGDEGPAPSGQMVGRHMNHAQAIEHILRCADVLRGRPAYLDISPHARAVFGRRLGPGAADVVPSIAWAWAALNDEHDFHPHECMTWLGAGWALQDFSPAAMLMSKQQTAPVRRACAVHAARLLAQSPPASSDCRLRPRA